VLESVVSAGASLLAYDASGCGQSEGEYISLGFFEREDLAAVIEHLRGAAAVNS